jgi:hypothetical protein
MQTRTFPRALLEISGVGAVQTFPANVANGLGAPLLLPPLP